MVKISFWLENHAYILVHEIELTASYFTRIIGDYQIIILLLKTSGHPVVFQLPDLNEWELSRSVQFNLKIKSGVSTKL